MNMQHRDCGIIILNYNTAEDSICAAKSIIDNTKKYSYVICIADNNSTKPGEFDKLNGMRPSNVELIKIEKNEGYAKGNNQGMRFLLSRYIFKYIIVMNPDVQIIEKGTIDRLLDRLEALPQIYCGVQPMVWTPYLGEAYNQTHIRTVHSYWDCIVNHSFLLKKIFRSSFQRTIYYRERPYNKEMDFEVPSGAFFIMRTDDFVQIDLFDEDTFLYGEEMILGMKFKNIGKRFRFIPSEIVQHEGGKSIGSNSKRVKWYAVKYSMQSLNVYLTKYLHCGYAKIGIVYILIITDFCVKFILYKLKLK